MPKRKTSSQFSRLLSQSYHKVLDSAAVSMHLQARFGILWYSTSVLMARIMPRNSWSCFRAHTVTLLLKGRFIAGTSYWWQLAPDTEFLLRVSQSDVRTQNSSPLVDLPMRHCSCIWRFHHLICLLLNGNVSRSAVCPAPRPADTGLEWCVSETQEISDKTHNSAQFTRNWPFVWSVSFWQVGTWNQMVLPIKPCS